MSGSFFPTRSSRMVTAQAQLEQVHAFNHHLRSAIDQVDEGVVIIGAELIPGQGPRILYANRRAAELTGLSEADLLSSTISRIYDPEKLGEFLNALPLVAQRKRTFQTDKQLQTANGGLMPCRWTISGVAGADGQPLNYTLTFREMPVAEAAVVFPGEEQSQDPVTPEAPKESSMERSRSESLALLAGGIAHDFNNVLTTILANLSLARLGTSVSDEIRQQIEEASEAAESAQTLTRQLLSFAKGTPPAMKIVNAGQVVRKAARLATMGSNVRCDFDIASALWSTEVDETQITQVFHNLVINGRQAMANGGVIHITADNVRIEEENEGGLRPGYYVMIAVRDRGCGIPEDKLAHIFEPYYTTRKTGTGLGLATCDAIVKRHHGRILAQSKVNVGTEFRVYLPACASPVEEEEETGPEQIIRGQGSVLVVDDQDGVRMVAVQILRKLGYDVISALDGEEALRIYTARLHTGQPISAVLMDMTLPGGMSGEDTMREIRRLDPDVRSIASSGYFDDQSRARLKEEGYLGILPKPYTAEKLSAALHAAMTS